jgi:TonB family protein
VQDLEYCLGSWFTGLGNEETVTVQVPALGEQTLTIPPMPAPAVPARSRSAAVPVAAEEAETLVIVGPAPAIPDDDVEVPATLVLEAGPPPSGSEATVLLAAAPMTEEVLPATVVMSPPAPSRTLPPEPTLREAAPATGATPARPAPRAGAPGGWALAGAAAVLALAVAGWALWQRSREVAPTGEPSPPAAAASGSRSAAPPAALALQPGRAGALRIESEPPGARVSVNGQAKGQTPIRLSDLPFGSYQVRVEQKGYDPQTRDVTLRAGSAAGVLQFALVRTAAAVPGGADVVSTPPGASVSVDGRSVGTTPLAGLKLRPGRHRLEVALAEHETWSGAVDVAAGETGRVEVRLRALPKPSTPPTPEPVDVARVYENTAREVDTLAKKVAGTSPSYPSDRAPRLKSGERVSVLVHFVVTETGEVQDVSVAESAGKAVDDVVASAVRGWKFQPATRHGTRVKVRVVFKQTFLGG